MAADFESAVRVVLDHEGSAYVNHPADPGGPTRYGISLAWFRTVVEDADEGDIRDMSLAQAKALYRRYWWEAHGYDRFVGQRVATKVMDMAVNMGHTQAVKLLQRALVAAGFPVDVDGALGPKTIEAANLCQEVRLLSKLVGEQSDFYRRLASRRPEFQPFLAGWLARSVWPLGSAEVPT